jgi:hypothetical protein
VFHDPFFDAVSIPEEDQVDVAALNVGVLHVGTIWVDPPDVEVLLFPLVKVLPDNLAG